MSVTLLVPIQHRPFRGYDDPGLPNGIWIIQSSVLGDASGNNLGMDIVFKDGSRSVPESSLLYNLEQLMVQNSDSTSINVGFNPANWDTITPGATGATADVTSFLLQSLSAVNGASFRGDNGVMRQNNPLFLGQPRKNTVNTIIRFQTTNGTFSLSIKAEGYYWGPEAVTAPGGPRRPVDSLYG